MCLSLSSSGSSMMCKEPADCRTCLGHVAFRGSSWWHCRCWRCYCCLCLLLLVLPAPMSPGRDQQGHTAEMVGQQQQGEMAQAVCEGLEEAVKDSGCWGDLREAEGVVSVSGGTSVLGQWGLARWLRDSLGREGLSAR